MARYVFAILILAPTVICGHDSISYNGVNEAGLNESHTAVISSSEEHGFNGNNTQNQRIRRASTYSHKAFKYSTSTENGKQITTLWYYNSEGPNYKFTIAGGPPAPRNQMIQWLEKNSRYYKLTPVPFGGDAPDAPQGESETATEHVTSAKPLTHLRPLATRPPLLTATTQRKKITATTVKTTTTPKYFDHVADFLPAVCGLSGGQLMGDKIVGGDETEISDTPWQVALVRRASKSLACGGSIISIRHVITATHCFRSKEEEDPEPIFVKKEDRLVVAGATNLRSDSYEPYTIAKLFLHNDYTEETRNHDIALIFINGRFDFGSTIFPICLPNIEENIHPGQKCKISGWGLTSSEAIRTEPILRSTEVEVTTERECKAKNERALPITSGMVCAGNYEKGGVDTCQGDSGGPLACRETGRYKLCGVTSWGIGCADAGYPGVYTKVPNYVKWLKDRISLTIKG